MWILALIAGNTDSWVLSGHVTTPSPALQQAFPYFTPGLFLPMPGCVDGYYFTVCPPLLESHPGTWERVPGPPEAGAALTPSLPSPLDVLGRTWWEWCPIKPGGWEPALLGLYISTQIPTFCFVSVIMRQDPEIDVFAWIRAESPLMIHAYFSQTRDVPDKYILVLFLIGKSNRS